MKRLLFMILVAFTACSTSAANKTPKPVEIHVAGNYGPAPSTVNLSVIVTPDPHNRGLWVAVEATGYAGAHYEDLAGLHAPKQRIVTFKGLPGGVYTAWARLLKDKGEVSASDTFDIDGPYTDDCQDFNANGDCLDPQP